MTNGLPRINVPSRSNDAAKSLAPKSINKISGTRNPSGRGDAFPSSYVFHPPWFAPKLFLRPCLRPACEGEGWGYSACAKSPLTESPRRHDARCWLGTAWTRHSVLVRARKRTSPPHPCCNRHKTLKSRLHQRCERASVPPSGKVGTRRRDGSPHRLEVSREHVVELLVFSVQISVAGSRNFFRLMSFGQRLLRSSARRFFCSVSVWLFSSLISTEAWNRTIHF